MNEASLFFGAAELEVVFASGDMENLRRATLPMEQEIKNLHLNDPRYLELSGCLAEAKMGSHKA